MLEAKYGLCRVVLEDDEKHGHWSPNLEFTITFNFSSTQTFHILFSHFVLMPTEN